MYELSQNARIQPKCTQSRRLQQPRKSYEGNDGSENMATERNRVGTDSGYTKQAHRKTKKGKQENGYGTTKATEATTAVLKWLRNESG